MEHLEDKKKFLKTGYAAMLNKLDADATRKWGKMNVQQMIEHMSDYVRIANGRAPIAVVTPDEKLPGMQKFLASEKPFPENTPNSLMPDEPVPVRLGNKQEAIAELQSELDHFFLVHDQEEGRMTANPFFGVLGYEQQIQLLHKHAMHHLRQFGVIA